MPTPKLPEAQLTLTDIARVAKLKVPTIHNYHSTGRLSEPDGWLGRTPWWWASTVRAWVNARPKNGDTK